MESSSFHGDSRRSHSRSSGGGRSTSGQSSSISTPDCSHHFHSRCVSDSGIVANGSAGWRDLPSLRSTNTSLRQPPSSPAAPTTQPFFRPMEPRVFDDDDPVDRTPRRPVASAAEASDGGGAVALATHCEYSALARDASVDDFAVLVHARAPGIASSGSGGAPRAPVDLVTVLDVSGSMVGTKLELLKQAMGFVIDNLGPRDRLCVVSFSSAACRLMRLARMSDAGKDLARRAVGSLKAGGGTNIGEALRRAAKVIDERMHRNAVASVVLLSDGQDTYTVPKRGGYGRGSDANYDALVPPSLAYEGEGRRSSAPVHTFGFGTDHDAAAMHTIAEATGGTFSFIEDEAAIQDAFAQCIGGLLSVAVQDLRVDVACVDLGVRVREVRSGSYASHVDAGGRAASVDFGELYADEERRFLLFLHVPRARAVDNHDATRLVRVACAYRDTATGRAKSVAVQDAVVLRPWGGAVAAERSVEVERERVRLEAMDGIAAARAAAERGAHAEAADILRSRQRAVARSAAARSGDSACLGLSRELREMRSRVADRRRYEVSGRAYVLAGLSSHAQQRATSRQMMMSSGGDWEAEQSVAWATAGATTSYMTPAMLDMLDRSRRSRELLRRQQQTKERRTF
ncbi:hypothetical protein HU200_022177 [Digitaria exilis]|uniref:VWFA domain-containing protein n=1 Tax=Digitaria exilis TaxID=1010633 RepID=A0A835C5V3_9POAL|nr:hypothetical protein HU200_022177 [Digitaria exilis]